MGKIIKNPTPKSNPIPTPNPQPQSQTSIPTQIEPKFQLPEASVVPLDKFDELLLVAENLVKENNFSAALQLLINLEVTNFDNITVHELLADVFLYFNQITLAKEQCQICAKLLKQMSKETNILDIKSFDEIVQNLGDIDELEKAFEESQHDVISDNNYHDQINLALKISTHYFSQKKYKEAENLLVQQRDRYLEFIKESES